MHTAPIQRLAPTALALACGTAVLLASCGGGDDFTTPFVDAALALPAAAAPRFTEPPTGTSEYQRHLDTATANAGTEFAGEQRRQWCYSVENVGAPPELQNTTVVPMTRLFDNLYYGGRRWVGAYVLKTATGYFLLDGQNTLADAQNITVPGLVAMDIDPATFKAGMPTHGHGDHYNGLKHMQDAYGGQVYIGSADAVALSATNPRNATAFAGAATSFITTTQLPTEVLTPQTITVDGQALTVLSTPGHTPGTVSGILPARLGDQTYKLVYWGGTGTPTTLPLARQYLDGTERTYQLAKAENVDGTLHTHPFVDGSLAKVDAIRAGTTGGTNPFLIGNASTLRSLSVLRECSAAKVNALDATVLNPVWLTTTVELAASTQTSSSGDNRNVSARVRVSDPYGPVANAPVTLRLSSGTGSCTATTDAAGVAACGLLTDLPTAGKALQASFDGTSTAAKVWLSSVATVALN
ncbi:MAG: MBL fold metallo-hydrolase [Aquabacterium sp.]|nr:MBL fold metallo-hydrolase [Aquabacterium sp.]